MKQTKNILIILITAIVLFAGCAGKEGDTTTTQKTTSTTTNANASLNPYEMSLERTLPGEADAGATFTVTLTLALNGSKKPGLLGITENYPSNWTVTNISGGGLLREKTSVIEWLFFPPFYGSPVQNTTLTYQITTPKGISGTYFFEGTSIISSDEESKIAGQDNITIK